MAQVKYTVQRGKADLKAVAVAAGSAEAQTDTITVNIDATKLTKGEAIAMIDAIGRKIHAGKWPPL